MLDSATASSFPALAEVDSIAHGHVLKGFGKEADRRIDDTTLFHSFLAISFIGEQGVDNLEASRFQFRNGFVSCGDDLRLRLESHRLRKHCFSHVRNPPSFG